MTTPPTIIARLARVESLMQQQRYGEALAIVIGINCDLRAKARRLPGGVTWPSAVAK
jgi:hypothetical protein